MSRVEFDAVRRGCPVRRPFDAELVMVHVEGLNVGDVQVHCGGHKFKCQPIKRRVQRNPEITTADTSSYIDALSFIIIIIIIFIFPKHDETELILQSSPTNICNRLILPSQRQQWRVNKVTVRTCCSLSGQRMAHPVGVLSQHFNIVRGSRLQVVKSVGTHVAHKDLHGLARG